MAEKINNDIFERLYRENYSRLFYYAFDFLNDEEICRDVIADIFAKLWSNRERVNLDNIESYLKTSVRNECINKLRKQRIHERYTKYILEFSENETSEESWQELEERLSRMEAKIQTMSEKTRFVLEQCSLHAHTYKEVAEMMGITTDAVKSHIVRAYAALRELYNIKNVKK